MPKTASKQIEKLKDKLPTQYQKVVNDTFRSVEEVESNDTGVHVAGHLAQKAKITNYRPGADPYYISRLKSYPDGDVYLTLTFRPGVEI